jgi:hypothetical protein
MSGRRSRSKGARTERSIVNALQANGMAAVRVRLSGVVGGRFAGGSAAPEQPAANYSRLSRLDDMGLIWLLRGRPVTSLTEIQATIQHTALTYRKRRKPALGPVGGSLDDMGAVT